MILSLLKSQANHSHRSFLKSDESNSLTSLFCKVEWSLFKMSDLERKTEEQKSERIPNSDAVLLCRVLKLDKLNVTQSTEFLCV